LSRNAPTVGFIWASPTRNFAKSATVSGYPAKNLYLTPKNVDHTTSAPQT